MTTSPTTLRFLTVLFLLAGLLLLKKPVFGQTITTAPTHVSVVNSPREPVSAQTNRIRTNMLYIESANRPSMK